MKTAFILVAALAATITTAAAQTGTTKAGTTTSGGTAAPEASRPNYTPARSVKPTKTPGTVTRSGGQGHNTTHPPKGQIQMAPTTPAAGKSGGTGSGNTETMSKNAAPKAKSGGQ